MAGVQPWRDRNCDRKMDSWTRLYTWLKGELVGTDRLGNRYFRAKGGKKRWVAYKDEVEASRVPPEWHAWLHYTIDELPREAPPRPWEKDHQPNLTGTPAAYRPPGAVERGGARAAATGDYEAWRPE